MATIPSLALIPSGYKASKVYSVLPTDGSGDLTFTRATDTATRVNSDGLIELVSSNVPRLNYPLIDGVVQGCPSLLLEPQRTNLALYSEQINNTGFWALTNSGTITANSTISPDGYQNADTLNAGAASSQVQGLIVGTSGVVYTVSIWVKRITGTGNVFLRAVENTNTLIAVTSDWQRFTATVTSTTTTIRIGINLATSGDAVAVWGGQIEAGAYATSYIGPTLGAVVTRGVDAASKTSISSLIGQTEGTLFADFEFNGNYDISGNIPINIYTGSSEAYVFISSAGILFLDIVVAGVLSARISGAIGAVGRKKIAFAYKANDFVGYMNGIQIGTDTSGSIGAMDSLSVGAYKNTGYSTTGGVNQALLFKTRLSNADLAALTA
jgi:hypothetical protein